MKKLERILGNEFKMIILEDRINIVNFKRIEELKSDSIIIVDLRTIHIKGENLNVRKMANHELLITGKVKKIDII